MASVNGLNRLGLPKLSENMDPEDARALRGAVHLMEDLSDEEFNAIMDAYNRKKRR